MVILPLLIVDCLRDTTAVSAEPAWLHASDRATIGRALVRAVALKVGEDSPARCVSAQESETVRGYALSQSQASESWVIP
jgi:hypothetical protein